MPSAPPDSHLPEYGSLVGSWIVGKQVGKGSYGVVFRAVHKDRPEAGSYALKVARKAGDERFEREAHLLSRVRHASVPRLEGSGSWRSHDGEDYPYLVMQWVEGMSLYAWAVEHGLTLRQAIRLLAQVARALEAVHRHGMHRDVKGGNVRVSYQGHAVLLDFGSCWYPEAPPLTGRAMPPVTDKYRSPQLQFFEFALSQGVRERYEARAADDVYALGVTAYRLLAGRYPPDDSDADGSEQVVPLEAPRGLNEACPELSELIVRMLSPDDPEARGRAGEVAEELEALLEYARPELDEPWVADASRQPTAKMEPPAPHPPAPPPVPREPTPPPVSDEPAWRTWVPRLVLAGSGLVLALWCVLPTRDVHREEVASTEQDSEPQVPDKPDAGTTVGGEGLASVTPAQTPPISKGGVTREVPETPLPGQKRPPCNHRAAVVINGGCWRLLGGETGPAPCDADDEYKFGGRCYVALMNNAVRAPTSEEPE
ncbi:MAG TPA: serine/threonine-protein kinase [Myxococcaceae bacterium]